MQRFDDDIVRYDGWNGHAPEPLKGFVAGAAGGLAGTIVMTGLQMLMMKAMPRRNGDGERDEPATEKVADAVSEGIFGIELSENIRHAAGNVVHFGFGTSMGGIYGVACEYVPQASRGAGLPFGAALMVLADEVAVPALGLSRSPAQTPPAVHAYALASHLVYGAVAEVTRRAVRSAI